jgi:3-phosphoshikimate 1-carboxyvinyltransferase
MSEQPANRTYPDVLAIEPLARPPAAAVTVPGSKSITNRALVLAALFSKGLNCELRGALRSEDTEVMVTGLRQLGFDVRADWDAPEPLISVTSEEAEDLIPAHEADLFVANSGTTMRFLTALVSLGHGRYRLDGVPRMRERPIEDLLAALRQLGVRAYAERGNGCPPVVVEADGLNGGRLGMRGDVSSQFLSGLLMAAPFAREEVTVELDGPLVSWPYVSMTVEMMRRWGVQIWAKEQRRFHVGKPQWHGVGGFDIEPDASAASYFFAAAAVTGGRVTVLGLRLDSLQGDVRFPGVLEEMGCRVERCAAGVTVHGRRLCGIDVDMNAISDCVMTIAAVACFADGPTTIRNVAHVRHKETDRLAALATELRRLGAGVEEFADGLTVTPGPLHGAVVETYNDHRMAMSLALVGLRTPGVVIRNPACVAKTYPGFFEDLDRLRDGAMTG